MVRLFIGGEALDHHQRMKSEIMRMLPLGEKVGLICLDEHVSYFKKINRRSIAYSLENVTITKPYFPLTIFSYPTEKIEAGEIISPFSIYRVFRFGFTSILIDDGQHILRTFVDRNGTISNFVDEINKNHKDIKTTIACPIFSDLHSSV